MTDATKVRYELTPRGWFTLRAIRRERWWIYGERTAALIQRSLDDNMGARP